MLTLPWKTFVNWLITVTKLCTLNFQYRPHTSIILFYWQHCYLNWCLFEEILPISPLTCVNFTSGLSIALIWSMMNDVTECEMCSRCVRSVTVTVGQRVAVVEEHLMTGHFTATHQDTMTHWPTFSVTWPVHFRYEIR